MNTLEEIKRLVAEMEPDADKLYNRNVKVYSTRLRKKAQDLKVLAQRMRLEALAHVGGGAELHTVSDDSSAFNAMSVLDPMTTAKQMPETPAAPVASMIPTVPSASSNAARPATSAGRGGRGRGRGRTTNQ